MIRAAIIIIGDVQGAGYRACVLKIGRKLGLVGYVENVPDGTVKIVCEGEKENIEKLINSIKIKTETIEVEKIDVKYEEATGEFEGKGFVVKIVELSEELFQGFLTAGKYFEISFKKQDQMLEKQDGMLEKQDQTLKEIAEMHKDMNIRFDQMAKRYDLISKGLTQAIKLMKDEFTKSRKEMREELIKSRKESAKAYKELAKAVSNQTSVIKSFAMKK